MPDMNSDLAERHVTNAPGLTVGAAACIACSLIAIGAIGAASGLMRSRRHTRLWPALTGPAPGDFTPPHGDKLRARRR